MTEEEVFAVVREQVGEVLPHLADSEVTIQRSLRELGANSIDRMDVVIGASDELGVQVPAAEFAGVHDLRGLVDVLRAYC